MLLARVMAAGAHLGGMVLILSTVASGSIILPVVSRLEPERVSGGGSPTNELMGHLLFTELLAEILGFELQPVLIPVFLLHSVSMLVTYRMSVLIRAHAKYVAAVGLVNVALMVAWLTPVVAPPVLRQPFWSHSCIPLLRREFSRLGDGAFRHLNVRLPNRYLLVSN